MSGKSEKSSSTKNQQLYINSQSKTRKDLGYLVKAPVKISAKKQAVSVERKGTQLKLNDAPSNGRGWLLAPNGHALSKRQKMALYKQRMSRNIKCHIVDHKDDVVLDLECE